VTGVADLTAALDAAHRQDILHRDIKPENILLREGEPVIADLGIALATRASDDGLTEVGISVGTVLYMSPEQATGERNLDARSDQRGTAVRVYSDRPRRRRTRTGWACFTLPACHHQTSVLHSTRESLVQRT
jgi:serine/threonine protein kinase